MGICKQLVEAMQAQAEGRVLDNLTIGLGYTAVCTDDGDVGVAYTPESNKGKCCVLPPDEDYEGRSASEVLELLLSDSDLHRTIGLALVNALNHGQALALPEDRDNLGHVRHLGHRPGHQGSPWSGTLPPSSPASRSAAPRWRSWTGARGWATSNGSRKCWTPGRRSP